MRRVVLECRESSKSEESEWRRSQGRKRTKSRKRQESQRLLLSGWPSRRRTATCSTWCQRTGWRSDSATARWAGPNRNTACGTGPLSGEQDPAAVRPPGFCVRAAANIFVRGPSYIKVVPDKPAEWKQQNAQTPGQYPTIFAARPAARAGKAGRTSRNFWKNLHKNREFFHVPAVIFSVRKP